MREEFVQRYARQRARERGFGKYRLEYRDINLAIGEEREISAYNEMWFVVDITKGIRISSDYGEYELINPLLEENMHEHGDRIIIKNEAGAVRQVKFIVVSNISK